MAITSFKALTGSQLGHLNTVLRKGYLLVNEIERWQMAGKWHSKASLLVEWFLFYLQERHTQNMNAIAASCSWPLETGIQSYIDSERSYI